MDTNLQSQFGCSFDSIRESSTFVTDGAVGMARIAGRFVSRRTAPQNECYVHTLNNWMKQVLQRCSSDSTLVKDSDEYTTMKKVVEDSKRQGWNSQFPIGFRLIQDEETMFGTHYFVAERFLKPAEKVYSLIVSQIE